jgi:hypothetical protein
MNTVTCDHCKTPIQKGESYALSEHGRLHAACLRQAQHPAVLVRGPERRAPEGAPPYSERYDPLFVMQRA